MNEEISLDIAMSKEEMTKIKDLLMSSPGLRHFAFELKTGEYLDLVEYKDYEKMEQENQSLKDSMQTIMEMVCTIEHNIDKYEEIGTEDHFEYAQKKTWELKDYLYDLLKEDK